MSKLKEGCVKAARGPIGGPPRETGAQPGTPVAQEVKMTARVGAEAPDFEANAFVAGKGFEPVKLSDHKGKWIVLCFYPGDFTFV